jgi:predicted membrane GTPase involved in stress response
MSVNNWAKKQSNVRSSGNDEKARLFLNYFLIREALEYIQKMNMLR